VERAKNHNNNQLTFHPHLTINDGSMHQQRQRGGDAVTTLSSREAAKVKNNQLNFRRHCCRIYASAVGVAVGVAWGAMGSGATKTINRTLASTKANQKIKTTIKSPCTITIDDRLTVSGGNGGNATATQ